MHLIGIKYLNAVWDAQILTELRQTGEQQLNHVLEAVFCGPTQEL
jgi:hypothetical protein